VATISFSENKSFESIVTRVASTESRAIQVLSPINGKKQIIDYGFNLSHLDLMVYAKNNIDESKIYSLYSEDFTGTVYPEQINVASYAGVPYNIISISAIGENAKQSSEYINGNGIYVIKGIENYYSVTYQTNYIQNIGTGYSVSISSKDDNHEIPVNIQFKDYSVQWGDSGAKIIGSGANISRLMSSKTFSYSDPLGILLQKTVIFSTMSEENNQLIQAVGRDKVAFFSSDKTISLIHDTLNKGEIGTFIKTLINGEIPIIDDKQSKSPIVKALQNSSDAKGYIVNAFNSSIQENWLKGTILSVGSILSQILPVFGLELYYEEGGFYSLEPPRFLDPSIEGQEISESDVISISVETPKINLPSLVIPSIDFTNMSLNSVATKCSEVMASKIVSAISEVLPDLPVFKIETYEVPNMLLPQYMEIQKNSLSNKINSYFSNIWKYYSSLAFKSFFQGMNSGRIELTFRPDIIEPHKWYKIAGEKYYITEIVHSVQRGNASTVLTYAGRYDKKIFDKILNIIENVTNGDLCKNVVKKELDNKNLHTPLNKDTPKKEELSLYEKIKTIKDANV